MKGLRCNLTRRKKNAKIEAIKGGIYNGNDAI